MSRVQRSVGQASGRGDGGGGGEGGEWKPQAPGDCDREALGVGGRGEGTLRGSCSEEAHTDPSLSGRRASETCPSPSLPQLIPTRTRAEIGLWDILFFLLIDLMWLSYSGQPFK